MQSLDLLLKVFLFSFLFGFLLSLFILFLDKPYVQKDVKPEESEPIYPESPVTNHYFVILKLFGSKLNNQIGVKCYVEACHYEKRRANGELGKIHWIFEPKGIKQFYSYQRT